MMYGVTTSDGNIHLPTWPHTHHAGLHQVPGEGNAPLDREGSCWKAVRPATRFYAMPYKQELTERPFLRPHHSKNLTSKLTRLQSPLRRDERLSEGSIILTQR